MILQLKLPDVAKRYFSLSICELPNFDISVFGGVKNWVDGTHWY